MKLLKLLYLVVFVVSWLAMSNTYAQKQVKGKVLAPESHIGHNHEEGEHKGEVVYEILPGATVIVQDTNRGVTTDFDGNFSIEASTGEVLVVSFVGYDNTNVTVGDADSYSISLDLGNELEEVVVTSLGIKREAKALGYSIQTVDSDDIVNS